MGELFGRIVAARHTVRGRAALMATGAAFVVLALAFASVLGVYWRQLNTDLDANLTQQVADRARLLDAGNQPESLVTVLQEEALVWIGTRAGDVVALGGAIEPLSSPVPDRIGVPADLTIEVIERKPDEVERELSEYRIASAATADGALVVVAGAETEVITDTIRRLGTIFAVALPLLSLALGGLMWLLVGRVLRPVDDIRRRADEISGANLDARVPVPETRDEVQALASTVNGLLGRLEAHDAALREFTADASHELKSPVANLRALVDTADVDDASFDRLALRMNGEIDRLGDLVDNLLFLAAQRGGGSTTEYEVVDLDDLLFDEAELLAATGRVDVDLSGIEPVQVHGSRRDLGRLVRNLADNAARHANGWVALAAGTRNGSVYLRIADDGPGIAEADRQRVFERFTRLDAGRARDDGGSGLGLAIVAEIAAAHAATVRIEKSDRGGAAFVVDFAEA